MTTLADRIVEVLGAADTTGAVFQGSDPVRLFVVHASGSNIVIESVYPFRYDVWTGWSTNPFVTEGELRLATPTFDAVTRAEIGTPPDPGDDQRLVFAVPRVQEIVSIVDEAGTNQFSNFTKSTNLIAKNSVAMDVWYSSSNLNVDTFVGQVWTITTDFTLAWRDITQSLIGANNISADGQYRFRGFPEMMYRLNPASAGSRAVKIG